MGHHRREMPTKGTVASFHPEYVRDGAERIGVPAASDVADAGRRNAGKRGPLAAFAAMVQSGLTRLLAVDF